MARARISSAHVTSFSLSHFAVYAWGVLGYNILVILWGALVRATGSGAGCGNSWPNCGGEVLPRAPELNTLIEFGHRLSSGLALLLVLALLIWAFRSYPKGSLVRLGAKWAIALIITEALIGAGLVVFELVAENASVARGFAVSIHLANTFLLLAALTLTAWWASGGRALVLRGQRAISWLLGIALFGSLLLGISGAITALGDTLFPAESLIDGIRQDFSPTANVFIRLRLLHPLIAMSVGLYLLLTAGLLSHLRPDVRVRRFARWLGFILLLQLGAGLVNVLLLTPIWLQLVHLLLADSLWIILLLLSASALAPGVPRAELSAQPTSDPARSITQEKPVWKDYITLTKPKVISLLLFTTLTAMIIAAGGWPGTVLFLAVALGGYMAAGAANAINMVIDRDIDGSMKRTSKRPTVTERISSSDALLFALSLAAGSFVLLWWAANLLTSMLALAGLVFYVLIYTMLLKRRTWHNIVIGGAAGAFPPLVGWAAITGDLSPLAWYLFAIVFFWTPVHFWALALLIKDDYAEVGVPMLPVVLGEKITVVQIALYTVLTVVISLLPLTLRELGWVYIVATVFLNGLLVVRALQLYFNISRPKAVSLYKFSMLYLSLLFLAMAVDRVIFTLPT